MFAGMMLKIGYFAEPSARDVHPASLMTARGNFATSNEAIRHARSTADRLHADSFIVSFPDGTDERQVRNGKSWKSEGA